MATTQHTSQSQQWTVAVSRHRGDGPERVDAVVVGLPEIRASAATAEEAVNQVGDKLREYLADVTIVTLDLLAPQPVDMNSNTVGAWIAAAGGSKDDPTYDAFAEAMKHARDEDDRELDRS